MFLKKIEKSKAWLVFFVLSSPLFAYEAPSSPELFEPGPKYQNVMPKNKSSWLVDVVGGVGVSTSFKTSAAFSYTGVLGFGYRYAISNYNIWDFVLELDFSLGGDGAREVSYPIGFLMRADYGFPLSKDVNMFFQFGAGAALAIPLKQSGKFSPLGVLGVQFEFAATDVFRVVLGPRVNFKTAPEPPQAGSGLTVYYAPEFSVGVRFPF